ncbi:anthranilate synthase component I family protein [Flavobacterium sp. 7A]|uniref:anthranilate synthase component I family protein n=1 Tax=Flavobacterium sp. 7A TaxID=2940571 RepID=UPI00222742A0|nr:anthranilate synthase component I family protein [Flavobacterium sp. 7A]MCW2121005.1 para-aminobenzoate synthetase component 1 [Flavobacterium sp. 7A]
MRLIVNKTVADIKLFKKQLLTWSQQHREITFLDSNDYPQEYATYDCVLAVDAFTSLKTDYHNAFEDLKQYQQTTQDWLFGYLSYDLKNDTEDLKSKNFDGLDFPDLFFYQPKKLFLIKGDVVEMQYLHFCDDELEDDFLEIINTPLWSSLDERSLEIKQRISKEDYLKKAKVLLGKIHHGQVYEANFCMEFYAEHVQINPLETYLKLNEISKPPFSVFFKNHKQYLLSASPERYLKKEGEVIISQPIKGTAKRFEDPEEDERSKLELASNPKERAENIMITDLVRNDLSHTAQRGSVQVKALCEIKSFLQVHQMVSTITSRLDGQYSVIDVIKKSFPMGSMTGAPKISAMNIIEELEETKRGLYSGAVGYFSPTGDFDFNVVIRSILYNQEKEYVSFSVGSAITAMSIAENEYEECLLKAKAMRQVLE